MSILIFIFVVVIILALVCWLINSAPMIEAPFKWVLQAVAVLAAILIIAERAGLLRG